MRMKIIIGFFIAYVLGQLYFHMGLAFDYDAPTFMTSLVTMVFFAFAAGHAELRFGWRATMVFIFISFVVSLTFETVGVRTGAIYGPYHYSDKLPFRFMGEVPILIPIAWFMMIYASYDLVSILDGNQSPVNVRQRMGMRSDIAWLITTSGLGALAMSAWDLVMDPQMVDAGFWVWETDGEYFGIPAQNFAGWLATTFTIYLIYAIVELYYPPEPRLPDMSKASLHLPALSYAFTGLSGCISALQRGQTAIFFIGVFGMGGIVLAAVIRLLNDRFETL